jgi:hypothetical protein
VVLVVAVQRPTKGVVWSGSVVVLQLVKIPKKRC